MFQISSDKLRASVAILDLRGLKFYNIFKSTNFENHAFQIVAKRNSRGMMSWKEGTNHVKMRNEIEHFKAK